MTKVESDIEAFVAAREKFDEIIARLGDSNPESLAKTEEFIRGEGLELQRRLLQARLHVLFEREEAELATKPPRNAKKKGALTAD